jgi:hypothetical protein
VALLPKGLDTPGFQIKVSPSLTVAINISPKLSSDHDPGSRITVELVDPAPQPTQLEALVTIALSKCATAVVPLVPLTQPVKVVPVKPV